MSKQEKKRLIGVILTLVILICIMIGITYATEQQKEQEYAERLSNIKYSIYDMEGEVQKVSIDEGTSNLEELGQDLKKASEYAKKIDKTTSIHEAKKYHEKARKILNKSDNLLDNIQQSNKSKLKKAKMGKRLVSEKWKRSKELLKFEINGVSQDSEIHAEKSALESKNEDYWKLTKCEFQNVIDTTKTFQEQCVNLEKQVNTVTLQLESFDERLESVQSKLSDLWNEPVSMDADLAEYAEVGTFNCSAYDPCLECSEGYDRNTASGVTAMQYRTVAASTEYPFGTRLYIPYFKDFPNGGWFTVEDRGGAIEGNKLDIFMDQHADTEIFGRRDLTVYVFRK